MRNENILYLPTSFSKALFVFFSIFDELRYTIPTYTGTTYLSIFY